MDINLRSLSSQFDDLNWKEIGTWPSAPKISLLVMIFLSICFLGWFFVLDDKLTELSVITQKEESLKSDYKQRLIKAVNLEKLKEQKIQVTAYVVNLERQLPNKTEMDRLLSDINYAGISKGLQFEVFKPDPNIIKDYYAEVPITLKISGSYHKLASFAADLSALPRIVTLNNINLIAQPNLSNQSTPNPVTSSNTPLSNNILLPVNISNTVLTMEAIAKTFRYLDPEEVAKINSLKNNKEASK
jgi:type IV pilus assembly protein PilO